jgi:hypothetical protein
MSALFISLQCLNFLWPECIILVLFWPESPQYGVLIPLGTVGDDRKNLAIFPESLWYLKKTRKILQVIHQVKRTQKSFHVYFNKVHLDPVFQNQILNFKSVLRIRDILAGSGSADPCLWLIDPDPDPNPAIFVIDLQDDNKKLLFPSFFFLLLFEGTFTKFFKDKK